MPPRRLLPLASHPRSFPRKRPRRLQALRGEFRIFSHFLAFLHTSSRGFVPVFDAPVTRAPVSFDVRCSTPRTGRRGGAIRQRVVLLPARLHPAARRPAGDHQGGAVHGPRGAKMRGANRHCLLALRLARLFCVAVRLAAAPRFLRASPEELLAPPSTRSYTHTTRGRCSRARSLSAWRCP